MENKNIEKQLETMQNKTGQNHFNVYCEGGCEINPGGKGGAAAVIINSDTKKMKEVYRGYRASTQKRMEIVAVIIGIQKLPDNCKISLFTESKYVVKTLQGKYPINKDEDLWKDLSRAIGTKDLTVKWIGGRVGNHHNERCEELCDKARNGKKLMNDKGFKIRGPFDRHKELKKRKGNAMTKPIHMPVQFSNEFLEFLSTSNYMKKYHVNKVCAEQLTILSVCKTITFRDYMNLKTDGVDHWSRKTKEELLEDVAYPKMTLDTITEYIKDEPNILSCLRWYHRGLPLYHSIRKILVDKEVKGNCNWKR